MSPTYCGYCGGDGWVPDRTRADEPSMECPACHGTGKSRALPFVEFRPSQGPWWFDYRGPKTEAFVGAPMLDTSLAADIGGKTEAERRSNGSLIAAAPDLLRALEEIAGFDSHCDAGVAARITSAAIAKARWGL